MSNPLRAGPTVVAQRTSSPRTPVPARHESGSRISAPSSGACRLGRVRRQQRPHRQRARQILSGGPRAGRGAALAKATGSAARGHLANTAGSTVAKTGTDISAAGASKNRHAGHSSRGPFCATPPVWVGTGCCSRRSRPAAAPEVSPRATQSRRPRTTRTRSVRTGRRQGASWRGFWQLPVQFATKLPPDSQDPGSAHA